MQGTHPQSFYLAVTSDGRRSNAPPRGSKDETRQDPDQAQLGDENKTLECGTPTTEGTYKLCSLFLLQTNHAIVIHLK